MNGPEQQEWSKLSGYRPYAGVLVVAGLGLFVGNLLEIEAPYNATLATLTLLIAAGGAGWLWHLTIEQKRRGRRARNRRDWP